MRSVQRALLLAGVFALMACTEKPQSPQDRCVAEGGEFRVNEEANYFDEGACFKPTLDAGKACNESALCQSFCIGKDAQATAGQCYHETPFRGCAWVLNGGHILEVCQE